FLSSRRRHTRFDCDWSSDVCSSDLMPRGITPHGSEGPRVWLLELEGVAYRQLVANGTPILTSGLGGVMPRGIPIGVVVGVAAEAEGWERTYLLRPAVHPAAVTPVMILGGTPARGDLRSVFEASGEAP